MILDLGLPKVVRSTVPPIGVKIRGVKKATPASPYFFHTCTNRRLRLEKTRLLLKIRDRNFSRRIVPKYVNKNTLAIIPPTVMATVIVKLNPAAYPKVGPAINLSIVNKNIVTPLIISPSILSYDRIGVDQVNRQQNCA